MIAACNSECSLYNDLTLITVWVNPDTFSMIMLSNVNIDLH